MIKQEFSELRRALGYERLVIRRIFHMYVSNENEVIWQAEDDFQVLDEERQNRIRDILKELLSTSVTVKTHPGSHRRHGSRQRRRSFFRIRSEYPGGVNFRNGLPASPQHRRAAERSA